MDNKKLNPVALFVEGVKEFAEIKDKDIKDSLLKLGSAIVSDMERADYEASSDAETAADNFKVELGEYEARMLAETETEVIQEVNREEEIEDELPLEIDLEDDEDIPLIPEEEEETSKG